MGGCLHGFWSGVVLLGLLATGAVSLCAASGGEPTPTMPAPDAAGTIEANVIEVLDGDSLVLLVDGEVRRFEVLGADTAEWRADHPKPSAESVIAKRYLTQLILHERVRVFEPEAGATDQVGRRRGYVYRMPDGLSVDLEIVRQGYGKVSTRAAGEHEVALRWYEGRAKELGRGIWGEPVIAPDEPGGASPPDDPAAEPVRLVDRVTAAPPEPEPESKKPAPGEDHWVWITKSGSKYHREGCQHLKDSRTRVKREGLDPSLGPCRTCRPDG